MKIILIVIGIFIYILIGLLLAALSISNNEVTTDPETWLIVILWPIIFTGLLILFIVLIIIQIINKIFKTNIEL
jgi:hypothetical protein